MKLAIEKLCNFGYDFIGIDHFAKPEYELSIAQKSGDLHETFKVIPPKVVMTYSV
jgi:oxygen-independent coproporphyrinogen-3 oxidase